MLILSRKQNQSIVIGGNVKVTIVSTTNGTAKLGIEAPQDVSVNREEIEKQIKTEGVIKCKSTQQSVASTKRLAG